MDNSGVQWVALGVLWGSFGAPAGLTRYRTIFKENSTCRPCFLVLFSGPKGSQNRSKIDPKMNPFFDAILEVFWMAFWSENGTFWKVF